MSVTTDAPARAPILAAAQQYLAQQLAHYRAYLLDTHNQIQNTLSMHLAAALKERQALAQEVARLKDDNSFLRNQCMLHAIQQEETHRNSLRILQENAQKEERVRSLAEEVERIKSSVGTLVTAQPSNVVDFDEEECLPASHFDGLEVIREVSEHDLSVTMSLRSLHSELIEENTKGLSCQTNSEVSPSETDVGSQESLVADNCQIDNYKDALKFLKNYNNQGMKMTKKPIEEGRAREEKKGNDAISKIKRMRKIEDGNIKANQQNICFGNEAYVSIAQSKLQYVGDHQESVEESISSSKFKSRVKDTLVSLEEPVRSVTELLQHISTASMHALKKERIQDKFIKITFVGGLEYYGNCNEAEKPSGFGKLLMGRELVYHGQWRSGKFHGWGKLVLLAFAKERERSIIEVSGHFKGGVVEGSVVCTFSSGEKFMGQVMGQQLEKEGTFVSERGIMTGLWENSRLVSLI